MIKWLLKFKVQIAKIQQVCYSIVQVCKFLKTSTDKEICIYTIICWNYLIWQPNMGINSIKVCVCVCVGVTDQEIFPNAGEVHMIYWKVMGSMYG